MVINDEAAMEFEVVVVVKSLTMMTAIAEVQESHKVEGWLVGRRGS